MVCITERPPTTQGEEVESAGDGWQRVDDTEQWIGFIESLLVGVSR